MSDTPETDKERLCCCISACEYRVSADFARRLERERDEARRIAAAWRNDACGQYGSTMQLAIALNPLPWEDTKPATNTDQ